MAATTPAKRQPSHDSSGDKFQRNHLGLWLVGGIVFVAAWLAWTF